MPSRQKILLLTDYRGSFYSKLGSQENGFDLIKLNQYFLQEHMELEIRQFADVDFLKTDYTHIPVLYTSLEDPGLHYKSFIEDVILGLQLAGAWLIPPFQYLHAHHNKVFLEILRKVSGLKEINNCSSTIYGVPSECEKRAASVSLPVVIKFASGAGSKSVYLAHSYDHLVDLINKISKTPQPIMEILKSPLRPIVRHIKKKLRIKFSTLETYHEKFIVQDFIDGLMNDYKVLVYGDKYYVLKRDNRKDDFRASGSGLFTWIDTLPEGLLDFARLIYRHFDVPFISLDIALKGKEYYLIEFQFIMFGTLALMRSSFYFKYHDGGWVKENEIPGIEREFVKSIIAYLKRKSVSSCGI